MNRVESQSRRSSVPQAAVLVMGDLVSFILFALAGRESHTEALSVPAVLATAAPFILVWLVLATLLGAYRSDLLQRPAAMALRTFLVWLVAGVVAVYVRALWLNRPVILVFLLVTLAVNTLLLVGWRSAYAWWTARRSPAPGSPRT